MAIQFSCPYCTASVKVPDTASGKLGACPKCGTKVRIPKVPVPPAGAAPSAPVPPAGAPFVMPMPGMPLPGPAVHGPADHGPGFPNLFEVAAPSPQAPLPTVPVSNDPFDFSNVVAAAGVAVPSTAASGPVAAAASRKTPAAKGKPLSNGVLIGIGLGVLALVGVAIWQYIANLPVYEGAVAGIIVPSDKPISVPVAWTAIEVPATTQGQVIEYFKRHQTSLNNSLMKIDIAASAQGLVVRFQTTADSILVSVDPHLLPDVKAMIVANQASWGEARKKELATHAKVLCDNVAKAQLTSGRVESVSSYHDTVVLNALVRGLGRHVVAVANRINCPCVFEDEAGKLYFVVPRNTTEITVVEKTGKDRGPMLPQAFRIFASVTASTSPAPRTPTPEPEAPVEKEKPAMEAEPEAPAMEGEMKPDGEEKMMKPAMGKMMMK